MSGPEFNPADEQPIDRQQWEDAMGSNQQQIRDALKGMMQAYERRIRSDCKTQEELDREPWRCHEFIVAERALKA